MTFIVLLTKRYNLYKVLACSAAFLQLSQFCTNFFQLRTFVLFMSSKTSSSQSVLGLPVGRLDMGFLTFHVPISSSSSSILLTCLGRPKIICPAFPC